ncbi:Gfo/Idh/MocA family protein [Streptomyces sp. BH105]|uniref:Gfo/Idh/MocA family protein n=1 Tax=Streptomyces sp. BH105 TaxID=3410408 RepID=UPI003CF35B2B
MSRAPLRVGVVGAGNIAHIAQLPTLVARDDVTLDVLVSRREDPSELVRRWGFSTAVPTIEQALERDLDALFVLTPRSEHFDGVGRALEANVDVFCEKPLATATGDAERLADLADERDRVLMVGFNRRFAPTYVAARDQFGDAGADFCVAQKNRRGSEYRATFENAIHMVDLLRWFCPGEPVDVSAHAAGDDLWQEDGVSALIRFAGGGTGVLTAARTAGSWAEKLDAYGAERSAEVVAPDTVTLTNEGASTVRSMSPEAFGWATATNTFGFAAAVHHFLDRVRDRGTPLTSGREAARTQALLDDILRTAGLPVKEQEGRTWSSHATR